jgi:hypothetical protein
VVERAFGDYLGAGALPIRWVDSPAAVASALLDAIARGGLVRHSGRAGSFGWSLRTRPEEALGGQEPDEALEPLEPDARVDTESAAMAFGTTSLLAHAFAERPDFGDDAYWLLADLLTDVGQFASPSAALSQRHHGQPDDVDAHEQLLLDPSIAPAPPSRSPRRSSSPSGRSSSSSTNKENPTTRAVPRSPIRMA